MGYDVYITRRDCWSDEGDPVITREEWQAVLAASPELRRIDQDDTATMLDPSGTAARFFWYSNGQIFVKKPNRAVLMKMLAIAEELEARVMGDDREVYIRERFPDRPARFTITEDW